MLWMATLGAILVWYSVPFAESSSGRQGMNFYEFENHSLTPYKIYFAIKKFLNINKI